MTIGTDSRNVKKIIQSLFAKYHVDAFQLEIDLFNVWMRYMNEREDGLTPAEAREKIAAEYDPLGHSARGQERNQVKQEFMDIMHIDFGSEDNQDWNALLNFLVERRAAGQYIAQYLEWCKRDPYNSPKLHQIAQKPLLVKQTWRGAFSSNPEQNSNRKEGEGFYV